MCSEQAHWLICQVCYDKLALKDCAQQIKRKSVCGVHRFSFPLHMSGINLTSFFLQLEESQAGKHSQLILDACAKPKSHG